MNELLLIFLCPKGLHLCPDKQHDHRKCIFIRACVHDKSKRTYYTHTLYKITVISLTCHRLTLVLHNWKVASYQGRCNPGQYTSTPFMLLHGLEYQRLGGVSSYQVVDVVFVAFQKQLTEILNLCRANVNSIPHKNYFCESASYFVLVFVCARSSRSFLPMQMSLFSQ